MSVKNGVGPKIGGKPDSLTAARSSSQRCEQEANGNCIIDTYGSQTLGTQDSGTFLLHYNNMILIFDALPKFKTSTSPLSSNTVEIPRIPTTSKTATVKAKLLNSHNDNSYTT